MDIKPAFCDTSKQHSRKLAFNIKTTDQPDSTAFKSVKNLDLSEIRVFVKKADPFEDRFEKEVSRELENDPRRFCQSLCDYFNDEVFKKKSSLTNLIKSAVQTLTSATEEHIKIAHILVSLPDECIKKFIGSEEMLSFVEKATRKKGIDYNASLIAEKPVYLELLKKAKKVASEENTDSSKECLLKLEKLENHIRKDRYDKYSRDCYDYLGHTDEEIRKQEASDSMSRSLFSLTYAQPYMNIDQIPLYVKPYEGIEEDILFFNDYNIPLGVIGRKEYGFGQGLMKSQLLLERIVDKLKAVGDKDAIEDIKSKANSYLNDLNITRETNRKNNSYDPSIIRKISLLEANLKVLN